MISGMSAIADVETRSISAENPTGEPGQGGRRTEGTGARAARDLGVGWKVSPSIEIAAGETATLADIAGPGCVTHIWLTTHRDHWRRLVLRAHWDGDDEPAVETPIGDFFCSGWGEFAQVNSLPGRGEPERRLQLLLGDALPRARPITVENTHRRARDPLLPGRLLARRRAGGLAPTSTPSGGAATRSPLRPSTPCSTACAGQGHYVGTYLAWGVNSSGWWGEGEIKFYLDDDLAPTTPSRRSAALAPRTTSAAPGTSTSAPSAASTPSSVRRTSGCRRSSARTGSTAASSGSACTGSTCPTRSASAATLRVDVQALGWRSGGRYLPLQDDIASTAFFYSTATSTGRPEAPTADLMEIC